MKMNRQQPNKSLYERSYERIVAYTQIYLQCAPKAQITAMTVAPVIAVSQAMVGVSEAAAVAPASQLKVYRF